MLPFCCHKGHKHGKIPLFTGFFVGVKLFPLDCSRRLWCQVVQNSVDSLDFGRDAVGDMLKKLVRYFFNRCSHRINRVDGTDDNRVGEGALAVLDADGFEVGDSSEVLPHLAFKTVLSKFFSENGVGLTDGFKTVAGDGAETADAESRTRERLTVNHAVGKTESFADDSYLVLVKELERFNKFKLHILRQTADVVVRFYAVAFDDVGVNRALSEEFNSLKLAGFFFENADEFGADDFSFLLGSATPASLSRKRSTAST